MRAGKDASADWLCRIDGQENDLALATIQNEDLKNPACLSNSAVPDLPDADVVCPDVYTKEGLHLLPSRLTEIVGSEIPLGKEGSLETAVPNALAYWFLRATSRCTS